MTLDQFISVSKSDIEKFHKYWLEGIAANRTLYPVELDEGEWFEQLMAFFTSSLDARG